MVADALPPGAYPALTPVATAYAQQPFDEDTGFAFGLDCCSTGSSDC